MYAQALLRVGILPGGKPAPTGLEGKYACPMHPYVAADGPGRCTVCGMPLEKVPGEPIPAGSAASRTLALPAEAVLTTGRRSLVYVEVEPGQYRLVEPKLGPRTGDYYPVLEGLEKGQRVVARGSFLLDSQFQITGKPSLLYPEGISGGGVGNSGHQGHGGGQEGGARPPVEKPPGHQGHEGHRDD
jgi:Cu(I)/Ag(I) efflux system membrane fusion protein